MHLIKPCCFCADVAQVTHTMPQNWERADVLIRDGSGQGLPLFDQAGPLQRSTGGISGCGGLFLGSGGDRWAVLG